ncbi:MAG: hypothetical protein JOZ48_21875 [Acidobacteriaceae bacterium]|nr:hypothetical protein [Acidobacteriaceae bacterium]
MFLSWRRRWPVRADLQHPPLGQQIRHVDIGVFVVGIGAFAQTFSITPVGQHYR